MNRGYNFCRKGIIVFFEVWIILAIVFIEKDFFVIELVFFCNRIKICCILMFYFFIWEFEKIKFNWFV